MAGESPTVTTQITDPVQHPLGPYAEMMAFNWLPALTAGRYPTYPNNIDPGLSPTMQAAMQMAQGRAVSPTPTALGQASGMLGQFYSANPSGNPLAQAQQSFDLGMMGTLPGQTSSALQPLQGSLPSAPQYFPLPAQPSNFPQSTGAYNPWRAVGSAPSQPATASPSPQGAALPQSSVVSNSLPGVGGRYGGINPGGMYSQQQGGFSPAGVYGDAPTPQEIAAAFQQRANAAQNPAYLPGFKSQGGVAQGGFSASSGGGPTTGQVSRAAPFTNPSREAQGALGKMFPAVGQLAGQANQARPGPSGLVQSLLGSAGGQGGYVAPGTTAASPDAIASSRAKRIAASGGIQPSGAPQQAPTQMSSGPLILRGPQQAPQTQPQGGGAQATTMPSATQPPTSATTYPLPVPPGSFPPVGPASIYDVYASTLPVMNSTIQKGVGDALAAAGVTGNRFSTNTTNDVARIGADAALGANRDFMQMLYQTGQSDLDRQTQERQAALGRGFAGEQSGYDRMLQAAQLAPGIAQSYEDITRGRLQDLTSLGQWEQARGDQLSMVPYQDYLQGRLGYNPQILSLLSSTGPGAQGVPITTQSGGGPGALDYALQLAGIIAAAYGASSASLKEEVEDVPPSATEMVKTLRPVSFRWKASGIEDGGLIAEEVERINPMFVAADEDGKVWGVKYGKVLALILKAVQELSERVARLEA